MQLFFKKFRGVEQPGSSQGSMSVMIRGGRWALQSVTAEGYPVKFGEAFKTVIPSQVRQYLWREGVETKRQGSCNDTGSRYSPDYESAKNSWWSSES